MSTELGPGSGFTVVELKEAFRERGLTTNGTKAELIKRLNEDDPRVWKELITRRSALLATDSPGSGAVCRPTEGCVAVGSAGTDGETLEREERVDVVALEAEERDDATMTELGLLRREKELWEREQRLLRQELEMLRGSSSMTGAAASDGAVPMAGGVRSIRELLPEYDGTDNAFWRWRQQLRLLRSSYSLDESSTRILISSRLKGRALSWFYSKAEFLTMTIEELLQEMDHMFDLRPGKLALRREFESLIWKGGEPFCDYYHDKMILANRIPIAEDEIIDYLIEGMPDQRLQNQARLMNYRTGAQLLKAFEKVQLDVKKSNDVRTRKDGARTGDGRFEAPHTKGKPTKCFKCHETGHIAAHCKRTPARRACYGCGSTEHLAKECPKRNQPLTSDAHKDLARIASANAIQPVGLPDPYMIRVKIVTETANIVDRVVTSLTR